MPRRPGKDSRCVTVQEGVRGSSGRPGLRAPAPPRAAGGSKRRHMAQDSVTLSCSWLPRLLPSGSPDTLVHVGSHRARGRQQPQSTAGAGGTLRIGRASGASEGRALDFVPGEGNRGPRFPGKPNGHLTQAPSSLLCWGCRASATSLASVSVEFVCLSSCPPPCPPQRRFSLKIRKANV